MKYLCLLYMEESLLDTLQAGVTEQLEGEAELFTNQLRTRGCLVAAERLLPTGSATTLRPRRDGLAIFDGPALSAREQLVGFHLIRARDLNEAIRLASCIPSARYGCVEVRPVVVPTPHPPTQQGETPCAT